MTRDDLGRIVRDAWIAWARTQPDPKPAWLVPYDDLSEPDKEADRQIGDAVRAALARREQARTAIERVLRARSPPAHPADGDPPIDD